MVTRAVKKWSVYARLLAVRDQFPSRTHPREPMFAAGRCERYDTLTPGSRNRESSSDTLESPVYCNRFIVPVLTDGEGETRDFSITFQYDYV